MRTWQRPLRDHHRRQWASPSHIQPAADGSGPIIDLKPSSVVIQNPDAPKRSLRSIPVASYSRISLLEYADPNITAPRGQRANVQRMTWHFLDPDDEDDHSIKLFLSFSDEDIGIIERFGMDDDALVTEPVFPDEAVERLKHDQAVEIEACRDPQMRGLLISEHKEQMRVVREEKRDIYLADLTNNPFIKVFQRRSDATQAQRRLEQKLIEFRNELDKNRKHLYER